MNFGLARPVAGNTANGKGSYAYGTTPNSPSKPWAGAGGEAGCFGGHQVLRAF